MGYLTGTLGNVLDADRAVTAVLGYRAFQYWLPVIPGCLPIFGCFAR